LRDEATSIPGKYEPPDFIVSALQQSNVKCTWDQGDKERERKLTSYGNAGWKESFEEDDIKAYLASDNSSDESSDEDEKGADKKSMMRKALGLDDDSNSDADLDNDTASSASSASSSDDDAEDEENDIRDGAMSKQIKIIPGMKNLEEKIRSKLDSEEKTKELTPWEKYQERRKQKRKERRQATRRNASSEISKASSGKKDTRASARDDFFESNDDSDSEAKPNRRATKQELKLLMAGEDAEEEARDYDMRGIQRLEKNKGKKLKGSRKRKEAKIAADVSGSEFKVNVNDNRFKAVLDGSDGRFGIDKTDPNYKDTTSMREILNEQTKRRKNKRRKKASDVEDAGINKTGGKKVNNSLEKAGGASALSFLVQKLKSRVDQANS
jgi:hypothetical protein